MPPTPSSAEAAAAPQRRNKPAVTGADRPEKPAAMLTSAAVVKAPAITVRMPAVLEGGLKPVMKLTDAAQPIGLLPDGTVDISAFCACSKPSQDVFLRVGNQTKTATYRLNIVATGPLAPQDVYEETTFSLKTGVLKLSLPVIS